MADDQGMPTFGRETVLISSGEQSLGVVDTDGDAFGEAVITVAPGGAPGRHGGGRGLVSDWSLLALGNLGTFLTDAATVIAHYQARATGPGGPQVSGKKPRRWLSKPPPGPGLNNEATHPTL